MKPKSESERRERQDWGIVLIILLIGFLCVILAGQQALRLSPSWKLNANMESGIDPNSNFLTDKPVGFIEPVDSNILTQPAWVRVFLTPGAKFTTGTPRPVAAADTKVSSTEPTAAVFATNTIPVNTNTAVPTNTFVWLPLPATNTAKPNPPKPNTPTNTSPPPVVVPNADLRITETSPTVNYSAGDLLTYTVTIVNDGPNGVVGAVVMDNFPTQVASWTWTCAAPGVNGCDGALLNSASFSDTVDLPNGASITYTVNVTTSGSANANLTNIVSVSVPAGYSDPDAGDNESTYTHTFVSAPPAADLAITNTDGAAFYVAGSTRSYTVTVSNWSGPSNITGATVTDTFSGPISGSPSWTCSASGTVCPAANGSGPITTLVDLPIGSSITYTIDIITTNPGAGNLVNTASVTGPIGYIETASGDESVTDTDTLFVIPGPPPGDLGNPGTPPGTGCNLLNIGDIITFSVPVTIDDDGAPDLLYYEELQPLPVPPFPPATPGILMDEIVIEVSDGLNWITVLDWGDDASNSGTNLPSPADEYDNFPIDGATLHNNTGILIDIPASLQNGPTTYIRITVPPPGGGPMDDNNVCVDALVAAP